MTQGMNMMNGVGMMIGARSAKKNLNVKKE